MIQWHKRWTGKMFRLPPFNIWLVMDTQVKLQLLLLVIKKNLCKGQDCDTTQHTTKKTCISQSSVSDVPLVMYTNRKKNVKISGYALCQNI